MAGSGTPPSDPPRSVPPPVPTSVLQAAAVQDAEAQPGADSADPTERTTALVSAGLVMAAGTAVSRLLGFVRAIMIAIVLGITTQQVEIFTIANTIPNSIYILLAGGVLNTVFVPQIVRAIKNDEDRGEAFTNRILTATLLILAVITVAVTVLAPAIIWLYSDSAWHTAALAPQLDSMVVLAYLCLPQIFFYGAYTLIGQVLNARGVFGPMMWAPIVNNVISVAVFVGYLIIYGNGGDGTDPFALGQALTLGIGSTLGIAAQAAILIPFMHRAGFRYRPRFDLRGTGLGRTFSLARWTLGFVLATQLGVLVITRLASSATVGGEGAGWTVYNNAYLLWILPHSLITVSLVTAMLPTASSLAADHDLVGVRVEASRTMRLAMAAVLPVAAAFIALAGPLAGFVLGWGKGAGSTDAVAWTLAAFSLGLVPFTVLYVCQRTYYAMEDTKTPFLQQCLIVTVNVLVAIAVVVPFDSPGWIAPGLALAYSFAYVVGVIVAFRSLAVRLPGLSGTAVVLHGLRLLAAVAPAAVAAWAITWAIGRWAAPLDGGQLTLLIGLVVAGLVAVPVFWLMARLLRIVEVSEIAAPLLRKVRMGRLVWSVAANPGEPGAANPEVAASSPILSPEPPTESAVPAEVATMQLDARGEPDAPHRSPRLPTDDPTGAADDLDETQPGPGMLDDPDGLDGESETTNPSRHTHPVLASGRMLGQRYRLEEVMAQRRNIATWRAFDEVLSRSVVCHVLLPDDPRTERVMTAARKSAVATDSRFLRVLDAVQTLPDGDSASSGTGDPEIGSYVVCEYAPGQNLQTLLAGGPLTALEAAWVVREVADAMSGVHSAGLYHQRLNPDTVIITPSGNIKIVGLLLEAALSTQTGALDTTDPAELRRGRLPGRVGGGGRDETDGAADDVADLGRLLYACLIQRWPGGNQWGLLAAPTDGHSSWLSPHQVRAGVSPALDRISDQILQEKPRSEPILTAHGVVNALTKVLGSADAASDLERRLRHPVPTVGAEVPASAGSPSTTFWAQQQAPVSPLTPATNARPQHPGRGAAAPLAGPVPPARPPRRRWIGLLVLIVVLAMLALLAVAVVSALRRNSSSTPPDSPSTSAVSSAAAPTEPADRPIRTGVSFDPEEDGGSGDENPDQVDNAFDGKPSTQWRTLTYKGNPELGGLKPGVGLVLDLGSAQSVSRVDLALSGNGTAVEIRVPDSAAGKTPPLDAAEDWRVVAHADDAESSATLDLSKPVTTRFVLVYFTSLPADGGMFRGGIFEAKVLG